MIIEIIVTTMVASCSACLAKIAFERDVESTNEQEKRGKQSVFESLSYLAVELTFIFATVASLLFPYRVIEVVNSIFWAVAEFGLCCALTPLAISLIATTFYTVKKDPINGLTF